MDGLYCVAGFWFTPMPIVWIHGKEIKEADLITDQRRRVLQKGRGCIASVPALIAYCAMIIAPESVEPVFHWALRYLPWAS